MVIEVFKQQTSNATSEVFVTSLTNTQGTKSDQPFLLVRGRLDGGRLSFQIRDVSGEFREIEKSSDKINDNIPSDVEKVLLLPLPYAIQSKFRIELEGAGSDTEIWIEAYNCIFN